MLSDIVMVHSVQIVVIFELFSSLCLNDKIRYFDNRNIILTNDYCLQEDLYDERTH